MLGQTLDFWLKFSNAVYLVSLAIAARASVAIYQFSAKITESRDAELKKRDNELREFEAASEVKISTANEQAATAQANAAIANESAAQANAAAEVLRHQNLELEKAVSQRKLEQNLTAQQLKTFAGVSFLVVSPSDFEPRRTAGQIRFMLRQAGWKRLPNVAKDDYAFFDGVKIRPPVGPDSARAIDAANALIDVLNENDIEAERSWPEMKFGPDTILIEVGPKPLPESLRAKSDDVPFGQDGVKMWGNIEE